MFVFFLFLLLLVIFLIENEYDEYDENNVEVSVELLNEGVMNYRSEEECVIEIQKNECVKK